MSLGVASFILCFLVLAVAVAIFVASLLVKKKTKRQDREPFSVEPVNDAHGVEVLRGKIWFGCDMNKVNVGDRIRVKELGTIYDVKDEQKTFDGKRMIVLERKS